MCVIFSKNGKKLEQTLRKEDLFIHLEFIYLER